MSKGTPLQLEGTMSTKTLNVFSVFEEHTTWLWWLVRRRGLVLLVLSALLSIDSDWWTWGGAADQKAMSRYSLWKVMVFGPGWQKGEGGNVIWFWIQFDCEDNRVCWWLSMRQERMKEVKVAIGNIKAQKIGRAPLPEVYLLGDWASSKLGANKGVLCGQL